LGEVLVKNLGGRAPAECLSGPRVERVRDGGEVFGAVAAEVGASREVLNRPEFLGGPIR
jgi:hypothetical protein